MPPEPNASTDTPTGDTSTDTVTSTDTGEDTVDWKAEAEKFKALHRKQEERAKTNANAARELEQLRQSSMTEQEKAVATAKAEARAEALREVGSRVVDAEIKAAAAGRTVDVEALLEGLDRTRFVKDDGEPDTAAIVKWMDRVAPPGEPGKPPPKAPTGPRGNSTPPKPDMNALLRAAAGRG